MVLKRRDPVKAKTLFACLEIACPASAHARSRFDMLERNRLEEKN